MLMRTNPRPVASAAAPVDCVALMRGGSKTFFAASRLLPTRYREAAVALYAFCRVADDEVDQGDDCDRALAGLHARLDAIYSGRPADIAADRAFAWAVARHRLPRGIPLALLEGFEWDARGRRYETLESLFDYCARVAGTVGAMMALVMGVRDERAMARACELGVAMQLTNIARDVGEDARMGRIYLPLQWLREEGIDPERWLADPGFGPGIARIVERLLSVADELYRRAEEGVGELPRACRPAILAARYIYADIGNEIRRARLDSISRRAVVSGGRKLRRLVQCLPCVVAAPRLPRGRRPLPAIRFLVDAAGPAMRWLPPRTASDKAAWMVQLFLTMAERERDSAQPWHAPGKHQPDQR